MDISNFGKGALVQPIKLRDYRLELAAGFPLPPKFSLAELISKIKNQNGSGSCVGQAFAYYAEVLNFIETGEYVELSARDIYSLIFQEPMGAYLKDGASKICNSGVVLEKDAISYDNGKPPSEEFMRIRSDVLEDEETQGNIFASKKYLTWDNQNVEMFKQAIYQGNGAVVSCHGNNYLWANAEIELPDASSQLTWSHAVYLVGYDDAKKHFLFVNSWGEEWGSGGFGYLPYAYVKYMANPFTLIDLPNEHFVQLLSVYFNLLQKVVNLLKVKK